VLEDFQRDYLNLNRELTYQDITTSVKVIKCCPSKLEPYIVGSNSYGNYPYDVGLESSFVI
jgi:hypothetical protein